MHREGRDHLSSGAGHPFGDEACRRSKAGAWLRTVFNILGPLTNPADASAQVIVVFDPALCETIAEVLSLLGSERVMVVHGDGMNEISNISETTIASLEGGEVSTYTVQPEDFGIARAVIGAGPRG